MYDFDKQTTPTEALSQTFVELMNRGQVKEAGEAVSPLIRAIARQESAVRRVFTVTPITPDQLDLAPDTDQPMKYLDIEPNSVASYVQFYGTPQARFYNMNRVPVFFQKLLTDEFIKNKWELMNYRTDLRKLLADNAIKDLADQEEIGFRRMCLLAVNRNSDQQRTSLTRLTAAGWRKGLIAFYNRRKPVGKCLLSLTRFTDLIDLPATAVGNDIAKELFNEAVDKRDSLWGVPAITSIKSDIYLPNEAWMFSPENYLGKFWTLQDATLYVEQRADIVKWFIYASLGIGMPALTAIQQLTFDN